MKAPTTRHARWLACTALLALFAPLTGAQSDYTRVVLVGDPQLGHPSGSSFVNAQYAMGDLATLQHDSLPVLGDLAHNDAKFYADYASLITVPSTAPVFSVPGNADLTAGMANYTLATGFPLFHSHYESGIRFIYLGVAATSGPSKHICHVGLSRMRMLVSELQADRVTTTIILSHAPVKKTTYRSGYVPGLQKMWLAESRQMRVLFHKYDNIVLFASGHVHYRYGVVDSEGRDGWFVDPSGVMHVSVANTFAGRGGSVLDIGASGIRVRVRNHADGNGFWEPQFERFHAVRTTFQ